MDVICDYSKENLRRLSDEELKMFIPDVYQKDIIDIDYNKLWDKGIRLISFDIDDTLVDMMDKVAGQIFDYVPPKAIDQIAGYVPPKVINQIIDNEPQKAIVDMLESLKKRGFTIVLLTNASEDNANRAFEKLNKNDSIAGYIFGAEKPDTKGFQRVLNVYGTGLSKENMAHIGNSMRKDVQSGNCFGVTTCLVRDMGKLTKLGLGIKKKLGINHGHLIRKELKKRNMWLKHHKYVDNDQYYQLGELPPYKIKV